MLASAEMAVLARIVRGDRVERLRAQAMSEGNESQLHQPQRRAWEHHVAETAQEL